MASSKPVLYEVFFLNTKQISSEARGGCVFSKQSTCFQRKLENHTYI